LRDVQAAIDELKNKGPVGIMGFCMGGTLSFLAACRLNGLSAAMCYYGGENVKKTDEKPKKATPMDFCEQDAPIPLNDVEILKKKSSRGCEKFVYSHTHH